MSSSPSVPNPESGLEPRLSASDPDLFPARFLAGWAVLWALFGGLIAVGLAVVLGSELFGPVLKASVLLAEVVGMSALLSARLVFPLFERLPYAARLAFQVASVFAATLFGVIMVVFSLPLFSIANYREIAVIVVVDGVLATVVGIALHTYDTMKRQLEATYRALRDKEALERELAIAREVQQQLLPRSVPAVEGLQLAGVCLPAVGVGGDYFDYLSLPGGRVGLVIADVSGKGFPAALLMAGLQGAVRSLTAQGLTPDEINRRLSEMLYQSTTSARYATLLFGLFDVGRQTLTYSNAGHYPPIHLGSVGHDRLPANGVPIGILEGACYAQVEIPVRPGDLLAFYTDGIVETPDAEQREFGDDRLLELLSRHRDMELDALVGLVVQAVRDWSGGGPPHDDLTLVLARAT